MIGVKLPEAVLYGGFLELSLCAATAFMRLYDQDRRPLAKRTYPLESIPDRASGVGQD